MRIAFITWEYPPLFSGGLGRHCYYLSNSLERAGNKVVVFTQEGENERRRIKIVNVGKYYFDGYYTKSKFDEKEYSGDFLLCVKEFNKGVVDAFFKLWKNGERFDVIHCHDWLSFPAGIEIKKKFNIPLVITFHSLEYDRCAETYPWDIPLSIEKEGLYYADVVIANSNYTKKRLIERYNADERKIFVIYNGIDVDWFKVERKDGHKIVLYLGRLTLHKGVDYFIEAAKKVLQFVPNAKFIIAGSGEQLPNLIDKAISLGIADKVIFTGKLSDEEVKKLYSISDVYVLPSISEPFGITILEAIASGTPAIVSKNAGVKEVSRHILTVDFWDVDELTNKIVAILEYPAIKKEVVKHAYEDISKLSWDKVARDTLNAYRKAIEKYAL